MDEGKIGRQPKTPEFPVLTQEDVKEIMSLRLKLWGKSQEGKFAGFELYTGGETLGEGGIFINSPITLGQVINAMAITRHSLVKEITNPNFKMENFNAYALIENKIMAGMKILDLGSSRYPFFARCCRAMGADVWTVDAESIPSFFHKDSPIPTESKKLEIEKHIQLNLRDPRATEVIMEKTSGNFNLVTEANLDADGFGEGREIAWPLIKKGGIYNNVVKVKFELKE